MVKGGLSLGEVGGKSGVGPLLLIRDICERHLLYKVDGLLG